MIRFIAIIFFSFITPFLVYDFYLKVKKLRLKEEKLENLSQSKQLIKQQQKPTKFLLAIGVIITIIMTISLSTTKGNPPNSQYIPAEFKNGKLIPDKIIPKEKRN